MKKLRRIVRLAGLAAALWALGTELAKDPKDRTWNGEVAGFVPYDFRAPSIEKLRRTYWDTSSDRIISPKAFGVGWTLNLAPVARFLGLLD